MASARKSTPGVTRIASRPAARDAKRSGIHSFEPQRHAARLNPVELRPLRASAAAWRYFKAQSPWYQRAVRWWVLSAKRETTRRKRGAILLAGCARGERVPPLTPTPAT